MSWKSLIFFIIIIKYGAASDLYSAAKELEFYE